MAKKDLSKQIDEMRKQPGKIKDNFGTSQPSFEKKKKQKG